MKQPACLDLYAYANGDPINNIDPDGRFASPIYEITKTTLIDGFGSLRSNFNDYIRGLEDGKHVRPEEMRMIGNFPKGESTSYHLGLLQGCTTAPFEYMISNLLPERDPSMVIGELPLPSSFDRSFSRTILKTLPDTTKKMTQAASFLFSSSTRDLPAVNKFYWRSSS